METNNFDIDSRLEIKFANQIKATLGMAFIKKDIEMDLKQGTDFLIFTIAPLKCGARLRRKNEYYENNKKEFTIRWSRPSGVKTEIHKIKECLVDYLWYGFLNEEETKIIKYFIGDLKIFRTNYVQPKYIYKNKPYDSELAVWPIRYFPDNFVICKYEK